MKDAEWIIFKSNLQLGIYKMCDVNKLDKLKKDIQRLIKEKSEVVKLDFKRKEDVDVFFND